MRLIRFYTYNSKNQAVVRCMGSSSVMQFDNRLANRTISDNLFITQHKSNITWDRIVGYDISEGYGFRECIEDNAKISQQFAYVYSSYPTRKLYRL